MWKVALKASYPFQVGEVGLEPAILVARTDDGTGIYRVGATVGYGGFSLTAAYGVYESTTAYALLGGKDRIFDPRYPGLYQGVAGSGKAEGFTVTASYAGVQLAYYALTAPASQYGFRVGFQIR